MATKLSDEKLKEMAKKAIELAKRDGIKIPRKKELSNRFDK